MIKSAKKSFFIIEKMKKYRKCPALELGTFVLRFLKFIDNSIVRDLALGGGGKGVNPLVPGGGGGESWVRRL